MFKKKRILFSGLLFGLLIVLFPYTVYLKCVQVPVKHHLQQGLTFPVDFERLSWQWLPVPRLTFHELKLSGDWFDLSAPAGGFTPSLPGRKKGGVLLQLFFEAPVIHLKSLPGALSFCTPQEDGKEVKCVTFPSIPISIANGRLHLPSGGKFSDLPENMLEKPVDKLNAEIVVNSDHFDLSGACRLPFAQRLSFDISAEKRRVSAKETPRFYWDLDISGRRIDLTGIRKMVLRLFGDHPVARTVCDIVRSGRLEMAGCQFQGFAEDVKNLDAMRIEALGNNVKVVIPGSDLPVEELSGRMVIAGSKLRVKDVAGRVGGVAQNTITHGNLSLGLSRPRHIDFNIGVKAAVEDLPALLAEHFFAENTPVKKELAKVKPSGGTLVAGVAAAGPLDMRRLQVQVDVLKADSRIQYECLKSPVTIQKGSFTFFADSVKWADVQGSLGSNVISDTSGSVCWQNKKMLKISTLDARLNSADILAEARSWPSLRKKLKSRINTLKGTVNISDFELAVDFARPAEASYELTVRTDHLYLDTPLLPVPARIEFGRAKLGSGDMVASDCHLDAFLQDLHIKVDMPRIVRAGSRSWEKSRGHLTLSGEMNEKLAAWLKARQWIPTAYFPHTPCDLEPLEIFFEPDSLRFTGLLHIRDQFGQPAEIRIDSELGENNVNINELVVKTPQEKASLSFHFTPMPHPNIDLTFDGHLSKDTADQILAGNRILKGTMRGDCRVRYYFDKPGANRFTGELQASGINIFVDGDVFKIDRVDLTGHENAVDIHWATVGFNEEKIRVKGRVGLTEAGRINTDVSVRSDFLSAGNLKTIWNKFLSQAPDAGQKASEDAQNGGFPGTGHIDFGVKQFQYKPEKTWKLGDGNVYIWHDLIGKVMLDAEKGISVAISRGHICDVKTTGVIRTPLEESTLTISAGQKESVDFQKLFSCLGIETKNLTGRFSLSANLSGAPDNWKSGSLSLGSWDGEIKKFTFMSKLFSVLNVIDVLSIKNIKNMFSAGYPYHHLKLNGTISDNRLVLENSFVKGAGLDFFFNGAVDLTSGELDMMVFVKPFGTIDAIFTRIPLVGKDLGGGNLSIAFIPLHASGTFNNPEFSILDK